MTKVKTILLDNEKNNWCHLLNTFKDFKIEYSFDLQHIQTVFNSFDLQL